MATQIYLPLSFTPKMRTRLLLNILLIELCVVHCNKLFFASWFFRHQSGSLLNCDNFIQLGKGLVK